MSFGERHVAFLIGDNSNSNIVGSTELAFEVQKLQLIVKHKDETIAHHKQEIANLREMISLLKGAKSEAI
jgi:hypothetical protein